VRADADAGAGAGAGAGVGAGAGAEMVRDARIARERGGFGGWRE